MSGPSRGRCGVRNFPLSVGLYLRVEYRLFPLLPLSGLFRCRFDKCNVQACALAACTVSVISTNDVAYLPGLPLRVPRRLWKVQDSNLRCLKERSLLRFTSLSIAPAFDHSANLPNMSILIVLFVLETSAPRGGLGMNKYKMFN